ncbi:Protein kinase-like domain protein [Niveomyces insectorum RCEF 264]|uniref:EKC/KEOPS complex subunit BUD32 n=1 Tax=Niveomyces insectorum RCEF 264 TaxID=1081102 RepID=A0A167WBB4_9HYPO|nr:Protein kinase-like domain protein [Niveomyces insectorum RCEF 264]
MWYSIIGMGASCFASSTDGKTVLKGYEIWEGGQRRAAYARSCEETLAREDQVYRRLGPHPQILTCYGLEEVHPGVHALRLELAPLGNVRQFIEDHVLSPPSMQERLQMALDVAHGLAHIHARGVQHADLSCRNLFLFPGYRVKAGDFGASRIEGCDWVASLCEEAQYELPCRGRDFDDRPVRQREIFALEAAIFEVMAWEGPYQGLDDAEIDRLFACDAFPSVEGLLAGDIILGCWMEEYDSVDDVVLFLRKVLLPKDLGTATAGNGNGHHALNHLD